MEAEDLSAVMQLIESIEKSTKELENALDKRNVEKFNAAKNEILKFQKEIEKII